MMILSGTVRYSRELERVGSVPRAPRFDHRAGAHQPQFCRSCGKSATADFQSLSYVYRTILEEVTDYLCNCRRNRLVGLGDGGGHRRDGTAFDAYACLGRPKPDPLWRGAGCFQ
jgi:hypothetical protein